MYWYTFEELYTAHAKRVAVQELSAMRMAVISGVCANSNYDEKANTRRDILQRVDDWYYSGVDAILGAQEEVRLEDDPFFAAMKVPKPESMDDSPSAAKKAVEALENDEFEVDQA